MYGKLSIFKVREVIWKGAIHSQGMCLGRSVSCQYLEGYVHSTHKRFTETRYRALQAVFASPFPVLKFDTISFCLHKYKLLT